MFQKLKDVYHAHMLNKYALGEDSQKFIETNKKAVFFTFHEEF